MRIVYNDDGWSLYGRNNWLSNHSWNVTGVVINIAIASKHPATIGLKSLILPAINHLPSDFYLNWQLYDFVTLLLANAHVSSRSTFLCLLSGKLSTYARQNSTRFDIACVYSHRNLRLPMRLYQKPRCFTRRLNLVTEKSLPVLVPTCHEDSSLLRTSIDWTFHKCSALASFVRNQHNLSTWWLLWPDVCALSWRVPQSAIWWIWRNV